MQGPKTEKMLSSLIDISREAGKAILNIYNSDFAVEEKSDHSPLTMADKKSHDILCGHLKKVYPFPVLSEEGKHIPYEERKSWEHFWLVDPLDGTKEFIKRNGEFTVNIALVHRAIPVLGIIYVPVSDVLYYAVHGEGSYRIDHGSTERLPITAHKDRITIAGSRSHGTREYEEYTRGIRNKYGNIAFISAGSSLKFCLVAEGTADIYPRLGPTMEWDTAAGQAIVEEGGGRVVLLENGRQLEYNKVSLVNPYFIACGGGGNERIRECSKVDSSIRRQTDQSTR